MQKFFAKKILALVTVAALMMPFIAQALEKQEKGMPQNMSIVAELDLRQKNILSEKSLEAISAGFAKKLIQYPAMIGDETMKEYDKKEQNITKALEAIFTNDKVVFGLELPEDLEKLIDSGEEPNMYIGASISQIQWDNLTAEVGDGATRETYKQQDYFHNDSDVFYANFDGSFSLTNKKEAMEKAIESFQNGTTLEKNVPYKDTSVTFLENSFAGVYVDPVKLSKLMKAVSKKMSEQIEMTGEEGPKNPEKMYETLEAMKNIGLSLAKQTKGVEFLTSVLYDPEKLKEITGVDPNDFLYDPTLYKKSPVQKPMMYYEIFNLKKMWGAQKKYMFDVMGLDEQTIKDGFKEETGLDLENDFMNFFEKEIVFVVGEQKSLFPSLSLLANVEEKSGKVAGSLKILNDKLAQKIIEENGESWTNTENNILGGTGWKWTIDATEEEKNHEPLLKSIFPVSLMYGVTGDGTLYISTDENFTQNYGKGVNENAILETLSTTEKSTGRMYWGLKNTFNYVKKVITNIHEQIPEQDRKYFDLQKVLEKTDTLAAPWDDLTFSGTGNGTNEKGKMFLHADIDALNEEYFAAIKEWWSTAEGQENRYENYTEPEFHDVKEKAWYYEEVKDARVYGITKGYEDQTFRPGRPVTRAEFIAMAMRTAYGFEENKMWYGWNEETSEFKDVLQGDWYYGAVTAAVDKKIAGGYPDNTFRPNAPITRAEAAQIIANIVKIQKIEAGETTEDSEDEEKKAYPDVQNNAWFHDAVEQNRELNIMSGNKDGTFAPYRELNRAEAAALMIRLRELLEKSTSGENLG